MSKRNLFQEFLHAFHANVDTVGSRDSRETWLRQALEGFGDHLPITSEVAVVTMEPYDLAAYLTVAVYVDPSTDFGNGAPAPSFQIDEAKWPTIRMFIEGMVAAEGGARFVRWVAYCLAKANTEAGIRVNIWRPVKVEPPEPETT